MGVNLSKLLHVRKDSFKANVITLIVGMTLSQVIYIAVAPILTRLYSPENFGNLAVFMSLSSILAVGLSLRYEFVIMITENERDTVNIAFLSVIIAVLMCVLLGSIVFLYRNTISSKWIKTDLSFWFWLLPPTVFAIDLGQICKLWWNRRKEFRKTAFSNVLRAVADNGVKIAVGLSTKLGALGLITGFMVGAIAAAVYLLANINYSGKGGIYQSIEKNRLIPLLVRYRSFPMFNSWSGVVNALALHIPVLMLTYFFNPSLIGLYALTNRVLKLPVRFVGQAVSEVLFKKLADCRRNGVPMFPVLVKLIIFLVLISAGPFLIVFFGGGFVFRKIFGEEWSMAGRFASIMMPWVEMQFLASTISPVLTALEKNRMTAVLQIMLLSASICSILLADYIQLGPIGTIVMLSVFGFSANVVYGAASLTVAYRYDRSLAEAPSLVADRVSGMVSQKRS